MMEFIARLDAVTLMGGIACLFCLAVIVAIVVLVWLLERRARSIDPYAEPFGDQARPPQ